MSADTASVATTALSLRRAVVDELFAETLALAEDARACFEQAPEADGAMPDPVTMIGLSCEWMKTTARLMQVIAWLLTQRAVLAGELSEAEARAADRALGDAVPSDPVLRARLPDHARLLIVASEQIFARAARYQASFDRTDPGDGPARALQAKLAARIDPGPIDHAPSDSTPG